MRGRRRTSSAAAEATKGASMSRQTRRTRRSSRSSASATRSRNGGGTSVDRNALLRTLFPNGIPPRDDVIAAANQWLDEAEKLARLR